VQITVKVARSGLKDPVATVRNALRDVRPDFAQSAEVEEVFPGVQSGNRAGLTVVRLAEEPSQSELDALVASLQARDDIAYATSERPRKSR
jgi:hypothetical protein